MLLSTSIIIYTFLFIFYCISCIIDIEYKYKNYLVFLVILSSNILILIFINKYYFAEKDEINKLKSIALQQLGVISNNYNKLDESSELFKNYKSPRGKDPSLDTYTPGSLVMVREYGKTLEELISNGEKSGLKYIGISEDGADMLFFLDDIYRHEENYPYLTKVFDAENEGYEKLRIKVFRIDYDTFHQNLGE